MKMFIARSTYLVPLARVDHLRPGHLEWVAGHYRSGAFLVSGRQDPPVGGVIVARAADRSSFESLLAGDPFVVAGVSRYEVTEFIPTDSAVQQAGFGAFWAPEQAVGAEVRS